MDLSHYPAAGHQLKYGGQYIKHVYTTSTVSVNSGDVDFNIDTPPKLHAHEAAIYILDEFDITDQLRINAGLRFSTFHHVGPFRRYDQDEQGNTTGTTQFGPEEPIASYSALEPRLSMRYRIDGKSSVKASYNRGQQYVHLASFSSLPTDVWIPSSANVKPQIGSQYAAGYFRDFADNVYQTSIEVYYKDMDNLIEYAEGAQPQQGGNSNYDALLVYGTGYSYGAEFFVKKQRGRFNGWAGYTWSRTMRQFAEINEGREFPSRWDRRHDLSLVLSFDLNERWNFGSTFVFATGQAVTLPVNRYFIEGRLVSEYTERNGYRMAPYHRLDLAATLKSPRTKTVIDPVTGEETQVDRKWNSSWTFGVYNVYNRYNPFFIYFSGTGDPSEGSFQVAAKQVSLFTILPSITWNFSF